MEWLLPGALQALIGDYGYWIVGLLVGLESMGLPVPSESALILAAAYAGTTHKLSIADIILASTVGAAIGDSIGYWIGRAIGLRLAIRFGRRIRLDEARIKLALYLFRRHSGKVVFLGRFVVFLRLLAALIAGAGGMRWMRFLFFNVAGGALWSTAYGLGGYFLGASVADWSGPFGLALLAGVLLAGAVLFRTMRREEARLREEAERMFPGPLKAPVLLHKFGVD